ncbi:DUF3857 domain-containing protein [Flavobacterium sp. FPG59]|jgi:hypothetical protein|uniref:DUF3857 domain-containing protein n=1 Tax=Flavobacterium sp. FPG59 TaxID=1929267 RepID=UPI0034E8FCE7
MMNFKKISILFLILVVSIVSAQEFKLGKVSIAELQERHHPRDTTAAAAILFEKGVVDFEYSQSDGFKMVTEVTTRIKIYKKEGYDWATKAVGYYVGSSSKDILSFSDVVTYNLVDGKVEKIKLKSDGLFDEKVNKYWNQKKITLPNVKVGSIIEYKYTLRSFRLSELTEWSFQSSIPVNHSEFRTLIPEYFVYNPNLKGSMTPKITKENTSKSLSYSYRPTTEPRESSIVSTTQEKLDFIENSTTYLAVNLPAMKQEAYVNNISNYTTSVSHELSVVNFPNQPMKTLSTDWASVAKTIYDYDDFGLELNKTGYFEEDLKGILDGLATPEEKIEAIFSHVKKSVKWNGYYGYSCNDGVKKAYKDKTGNVAEINLMLIAMLRHTNLNANPVLVSTRSNGISFFPNRTAFNYVIAAVELADRVLLLDATESYSSPNVLPLRVLNWEGRLIRKDATSTAIDLMPKKSSIDAVNLKYTFTPDGTVTGKLSRKRTDYNAMIFRNNTETIKEDVYLEKYENDNKKIEVDDYERVIDKNLNEPVIENITFKGGNLSEVINGSIYINPMLFFSIEQNPFKQETRDYPVDYGYTTVDKYNVIIDIPEGYVVDTMPASIVLNMDDNLGQFKFLINKTENAVQLAITFQINAPIIGTDYYEALKSFYQRMIEKQNEKIVFKKA